MDKFQALHSFFSSFGLVAYDDSSVPTGEDAPEYPYLTYNASVSSNQTETLVVCSLWYRSSSRAAVDRKASEISAAVGGAKLIECDEGGIIMRYENAATMAEPSDDMVKRRVMTFAAKFATEY